MIFLPTAPPAPVHVIVDHIPATPGLPIWATTLISAGIGALFGIVSGSLMEVVKPVIQRFFLKRRMRPQLVAEFRGNLLRAHMIAGDKQQPSDEIVLSHALYLTSTLEQSRFRYYLENEPLALYEIDENKYLQGVYEMFETELPKLVGLMKEGEISAASIWGVILNAVEFGEMFFSKQENARYR